MGIASITLDEDLTPSERGAEAWPEALQLKGSCALDSPPGSLWSKAMHQRSPVSPKKNPSLVSHLILSLRCSALAEVCGVARLSSWQLLPSMYPIAL